ncbi:MAG: hypothetical protein HY254_03495 [Burkholderiales bacterium]|nr:hypothetical protein [Burkholderiales bacterium]
MNSPLPITESPTDRFLKLFIPLMTEEGFTYRKSGHKFRRKFAFGTQELCLSFDGRGGTVAVTGSASVVFTELAKLSKKINGHLSYNLGGSFSNLKANPWTYSFADSDFINMTPKERSVYSSEQVHPQSRIEQGLNVIFNAYKTAVVPLFQSMQTYEQLLALYVDSLERLSFRNVNREDAMYYATLLTIILGGDLEKMKSFTSKADLMEFRSPEIDRELNAVYEYALTNDLRKFVL